jgi:hypothetical protein
LQGTFARNPSVSAFEGFRFFFVSDQKIYNTCTAENQKKPLLPYRSFPNPPSDSWSKQEALADHQQGVGCQAPRSDDWAYGSIRRKPAPAEAGGGASDGNAAEDALVVNQGTFFYLDSAA